MLSRRVCFNCHLQVSGLDRSWQRPPGVATKLIDYKAANGMGTATYPLADPYLVETSVINAIEVGYRHFDSTSVYQSEAPLGQAICQALTRGLIGSREELFITTKLWCGHAHPDLVVPALRESLRVIGLDYMDLFLIHFPARFNLLEKKFEVKGEELLALDMKGTWKAMEDCCRFGLTNQSIGISNFSCKKLCQLLSHVAILLAVNWVPIATMYWK